MTELLGLRLVSFSYVEPGSQSWRSWSYGQGVACQSSLMEDFGKHKLVQALFSCEQGQRAGLV